MTTGDTILSNDNIFELNEPYKYSFNYEVTLDTLINEYKKLKFKDKIDYVFNIHIDSFSGNLPVAAQEFIEYFETSSVI